MANSHESRSLPAGNETHPSHLPNGNFRTVYEHLWRDRQSCDRGTPMWKSLGRVMDALIAVAQSESGDLYKAAQAYAANYLLDELHDPGLCVDEKHHQAVVALFKALAESKHG